MKEFDGFKFVNESDSVSFVPIENFIAGEHENIVASDGLGELESGDFGEYESFFVTSDEANGAE